MYLNREESKRYARRLKAYDDYMARDLAARKLDEIEARLVEERQRRCMAPVTTDTGAVIGWVRTREGIR